jgi:hypothetical protein
MKKQMTDLEARLEQRIRDAESELDSFYKSHGEWDGKKEPKKRSRPSWVPEDDNGLEENPETSDFQEAGLSIIDPTNEPEEPTSLPVAPKKPSKAPESPAKVSKPKTKAKSDKGHFTQ